MRSPNSGNPTICDTLENLTVSCPLRSCDGLVYQANSPSTSPFTHQFPTVAVFENITLCSHFSLILPMGYSTAIFNNSSSLGTSCHFSKRGARSWTNLIKGTDVTRSSLAHHLLNVDRLASRWSGDKSREPIATREIYALVGGFRKVSTFLSKSLKQSSNESMISRNIGFEGCI
jgi:hypothetical protein